MGRPSDYSQQTAADICVRLGLGESLREICRDEQMPDKSTVMRWLAAHKEFRDQYAGAREAQADYYAEEIIEIADDGSNDWMERKRGEETIEVENHEVIGRSRLRVDTRKWLMARMAPKKYGERVTNEMVGKDGGPIETRELSETEAARRIAFTLAKAAQ
ncbi:terminase small subunit protein [Bradyrhizobium sp. 62]|uniref:terminase small subunit-like protein n=1 Tax=Bradyrhizobium sp. 62 TaxID=1043588 RepID=UPI001FFB0433|nr:terminase small subunit protein [Bradyrhizobium sp. 62]MCK1367639.1 terminase small subunit protein [Bradyrhizobium sp. 62]